MSRKTILFEVAAVVLAALLGFVPPYLKSRALEKQLSSTQQELSSEDAQLQGDDLDLLMGSIYLQTNQKNYGLASESSTKFFDRARAMAGQSSSPTRQKFLQTALSKRDVVTAGLAKGDPGTAAEVQELFQSALETTPAGGK